MSDLADERRVMARWAEAFEVVCGWRPRLDDLGDDGAFTCTFEPRFEPIEMLGGTGHFLHQPKLVAHLGRMGFRWSDAGRVLTAPSPASFNRLADRWLPPATGYRVGPVVRDHPTLALGPWMRTYLSGRIPIHLASDRFYADIVAARGRPRDWSGLRFQFESFAHDLTVHALNYQLIPRAAIDAFADRITAALPERVAAWEGPDAPGPLTLTTFFDNDLNRYCYEVWSRCEDPEQFAATFLGHLPQLMDCLDQRIEETRQGLGDVPDGDTKNLPPLSPCAFEVVVAPPPPAPREAPEPAAPVYDPRLDERARALRLDIARALVRAPRLPVDLPAFGLRLVDVTADAAGISLQVGFEHPVAALRISGAGAQPREEGGRAVTVAVETIHPTARRLDRELAVMAERLRRAITPAQWAAARGYADALHALPLP